MRRLLILFIVIFVVGCASEKSQINTPVVDDMQEPNQAPDIAYQPPAGEDVQSPTDTPVDMPQTEPDEPVELDEPEECDINAYEPQNLAEITTDISEGKFRKNDGLTFMFYPRDFAGNIMPVEGNLAINIYWTELFNGERRSKTIVYSQSKYIKLEDVNPDCSPQPVTVKFEDILADSDYSSVKEDDPGFLRIIFKRSGSDDQFVAEYMGEGAGFFP